MDTQKDQARRNREVFESLPDSFYTGEVPSVRKKQYWPYAAAAAVLALLAVGLAFWRSPSEKPERMAEATYYVERGVKGQLTLSDGTSVQLNSGSRLQVLGDRKVFLDGEGWFEVESDPQHPFLVETPSGITVKVTGTKFNLSNYKEEDFSVLLVKGSIELEGARPGIPARVKPSQLVTVKHNQARTQVADSLETKSATAWRQGVLVFDDKPLREAIPMLERWYGVHVNITSPELLKENLTGEFDTETIQEVMNVLSLTHRFFYFIDGKEITIAYRK